MYYLCVFRTQTMSYIDMKKEFLIDGIHIKTEMEMLHHLVSRYNNVGTDQLRSLEQMQYLVHSVR